MCYSDRTYRQVSALPHLSLTQRRGTPHICILYLDKKSQPSLEVSVRGKKNVYFYQPENPKPHKKFSAKVTLGRFVPEHKMNKKTIAETTSEPQEDGDFEHQSKKRKLNHVRNSKLAITD